MGVGEVNRHSINLRALVDTFNGRSDAVAACGVFEHPKKIDGLSKDTNMYVCM